ncbi:MAG TPA: hypothetical protein VK992_01770, partial [Candidatus Caenarcaniphilales bacterium]|nr:hypothetical protein [Candidatus Caenarcaniphilales bacterium]
MPSPVLLLSVAGPTAHRVERLLQARGFDVTVEADLGAAARVAPQHQLIIVEAADSARVIALTRRARKQLGNELPILAVGHGHEIEERVSLLEAGADDVLGQPFDERELEALVEALLLRSGGAQALPDASRASATGGARPTRGKVLVFAAAKGGAGVTTLAVNAAVMLAARPGSDVAIADLDMYHGQVSVHLDVRGNLSTAELARHHHGEVAELLPTAASIHASGLTVFGAPHRPDEAAHVTPADVRRLVDVLRGQHALVVVDAGTAIDARAVALLEMADRLVLVVTPEIPALRTLHALLELLADSGTGSDRTLFVLNQLFPRPMLSVEQIEENLGLKFSVQVPYDERLYVKAVNEGQPIATAASRSEPVEQVRRLAALLL